uniref:Ig-like domain-containing protein n=1 Tax=Salmo trutta TaxID=8032 RepID=A0A674BW70_SALTR
YCLTALCCRYSLVEGIEVTQIPTIVWGLKGSDAPMNCSHTKGSGYFQMYWYRQLPGEGMKQVAFTIPNSKPEYSGDFSEDKFSAKKPVAESGTSTLTINQLTPNSSAVYYCAASLHSASDLPLSSTKTSSLVYCRLITPVLTSHCI